jgi:hypothetical protein
LSILPIVCVEQLYSMSIIMCYNRKRMFQHSNRYVVWVSTISGRSHPLFKETQATRAREGRS